MVLPHRTRRGSRRRAPGLPPLAQQAPSVEDLSTRYLEEYAAKHKAAKSAANDAQVFRDHVLPRIGTKLVAEVRARDVQLIHAAMEEKPVQANRMLSLLSKAFNLAEVWEWRPPGTNPTRGLDRYKEKARDRAATPLELQRLWEALEKLEEDGTVPPVAAAGLRLLLWTGARPGEFLNGEDAAQWSHYVPEFRVIRHPRSKADRKVVRGRPIYICRQAVPVMERLAELQIDGNPYVLPSSRTDRPLYDLRGAWQSLAQEAEVRDLKLYHLRHTWATEARRAGLGQSVVGALLGHRDYSTTRLYTHLTDEDWLRSVDQVGEHLAGVLNLAAAASD